MKSASDVRLAWFAIVTWVAVSPFAQSQPAKAPLSSWPMFGGSPSRNMVNEVDRGLPTDWCVAEGKSKNIRWTAPIGGAFFGSPIIADGKVFVATNSKRGSLAGFGKDNSLLIAFRESDGQLLWHNAHPIPDDLGSSYQYSPSSPTVDGGSLYYVTPSCVLVRADAESGKIRWQYDIPRELKVYSSRGSMCVTPPHASPLVVGGRVFVTTNNGWLGTESDDDKKWRTVAVPDAPSFIAINKHTGKLLWQSNLPGKNIVDGSWASPVYANVDGVEQVIFASGDGVVYSFAPETGALIWKCSCVLGPPEKTKVVNSIVATPMLVDDKLYVSLGVNPYTAASRYASYLLCLDIRKKGDVSFKSYDAAEAENRSSALVWAHGGPPRPERGQRTRWNTTAGTPAVKDGLLYIGTVDGYFHCFDAKTGQLLWTHDLQGGASGSPYWVDNRVYLCADDSVTIFAPGRERKKLAAIDMDGLSEYSTPASANGSLFVAVDGTLYCIGNPRPK